MKLLVITSVLIIISLTITLLIVKFLNQVIDEADELDNHQD
jgi:hypothetical protein